MLQLRVVPPVEVRIDQQPNTSSWNIIPLYHSTLDGLDEWQIGFNGSNSITIMTNGVITQNIVSTNNAPMQVRKLYREKFKQGYRPPGPSSPPYSGPMKGHIYMSGMKIAWPVYTQPKINGIRMLCQESAPGALTFRSCQNNSFTHLSHLEAELTEFITYLPSYATLDGELYNHTLDFSTLTSAIRTVKTKHERLGEVQYHIFDIIYGDDEGTPYEKRYELLVNAFCKYVEDLGYPSTFIIVKTQAAMSHADIVQQHMEHVANGYEGIIIRKIANGATPGTVKYNDALYKEGKNTRILKYKAFVDEEVTILEVTSMIPTYDEVWENRSDDDDIVDVLDGIDTIGLLVRDDRGHTYGVQLKESRENLTLWHSNPVLIIGKRLTIKYKRLCRTGIPFRSEGVTIRDYE